MTGNLQNPTNCLEHVYYRPVLSRSKVPPNDPISRHFCLPPSCHVEFSDRRRRTSRCHTFCREPTDPDAGRAAGHGLIVRVGRRIRLTEEGERFFELIADQVEMIVSATQLMQGEQGIHPPDHPHNTNGLHQMDPASSASISRCQSRFRCADRWHQ